MVQDVATSICRDNAGFRGITPIMENEIEKNMGKDMATGSRWSGTRAL